MRYRFYTADVFSDRIFGGNQLAVFPNAEGLTSEQMQQVAREFNFSETAFVLPSQNPEITRRLRIFTPATELPFAGHPTVGTAHVLATLGKIDLNEDITEIIFEEGVGQVPVTIQTQNSKPVYCELKAAQLPEFKSCSASLEELAAVLSLQPEDLLDAPYNPQGVSCGLPFLFITLRDRMVLKRAKINREQWQKTLANAWAPDVYLLTFDPELPGSNLRSRMFAPSLGIEEDPATGSAATALAGYLGFRETSVSTGKLQWVIEQGFEMGRPSILHAHGVKQAGKIVEISVGGASVLVSEGTIEIPD